MKIIINNATLRSVQSTLSSPDETSNPVFSDTLLLILLADDLMLFLILPILLEALEIVEPTVSLTVSTVSSIVSVIEFKTDSPFVPFLKFVLGNVFLDTIF